ncbi:MAG: hypothetical protein MJZ34_08110 [Paludibacteraceae bacterium]|nr:hypothetical protein [Paludibacteraceae bacterium]
MLVENGQIIAIDSVTTDGVTISGDGVKKPLTATPYSGVDGIVVEDFKIGLDHEHDESKWKMYGEDERNLTPKKEGSSITLTMAGTITANDNVTAENNSIYVGENISAQTTDSVIVLNGATQKYFPYTAYTGGTYESTSSYSNTANKKSIEIEDIIDSRTQKPFVKEVYGKPTKLSAISNSFVAGEGNELTYGQNLLVNGFDNIANEISRSNVVGFCNYLSAMNSINLMGFNNTASMIEYTTLMGTYNTISGGSFINVYGHKNYVGYTNSINIYGPYNSAYQTINTIVNGVSNMLYSVGNSNVQGHYNYVAYTTGVNIVGTYIQSERDKFSIIRGMFISAYGAANNIIFNNAISDTITPTSQIPSDGITATINYQGSKLNVYGTTNSIIMKQNTISSCYNGVRGAISLDQSAYSCTTNTYINQGDGLLNIGAGNYVEYFAWISNIGARNIITYSQYVSMMGASNSANCLQHAMIYGAGNYVNGSKSVIVMGEPITASGYDVVQISLNNSVNYSNTVLAMGEDIYVYQNEGVIAIATQQNSGIGQKTISAYNIKDSLIMGKNSASQGQEYVIVGQYNTAQYAQNANIFGFNNFLGSASKTEIIGDNNNLVINNRKPNYNAIHNTAQDASGIYFKDFTEYDNTSLTDSCGGVQVLGSNNQISALLYDYNRYSDDRYRPIFRNISGLTGKELGLYVNGRRNLITGWGMMKVFGHDNLITGFHDFIDINGDNNCIYDNVHKTILYGDNSDAINTQESLLFIKGIRAYGVSNSVVLVRGYNGTYRESSATNIFNSFIASRDYYNNRSIVQSNILTYKGRFSGNICYSNINASGIEVASYAGIQRSNLNILPYVKMNAGAGIIDSNLNIGDVSMPWQDGKTIPLSFDYNILQSDVKISNLGNNYYKNDENKYVSKSLGTTVASNVTLLYCYGNTATSSNDFGEAHRSDIKMIYCSGYNLVVNSYLNLESCPKIEYTIHKSNIIGYNVRINNEFGRATTTDIVYSNVIGESLSSINGFSFVNMIGQMNTTYDVRFSNIIGNNIGSSASPTRYVYYSQLMGYGFKATQIQASEIIGYGHSASTINRTLLMGDGTSASTIGWSFVNTYGGTLNSISFSNLIGGIYGGTLSATEIHKSNLILRENASAQHISQTFGAIGGSAYNIHKSFVNICCSNVLNSGITNSLVLGEDYNNCTLQDIRRSIITTNSALFNIYDSNVISDNGFVNSAYFSNIITNNTPIYNVYYNILNVHGKNGTVQSAYYGLGIGYNNVIISAERFDIIGDYITAKNMNAGRYGCGYDATADKWISGTKYQNPKYLNITGSTFIHGGNIYASAKHFGEEYEGEIVEKPNSTFLVANGTSAIDNLNLTAFGNNIGEIQDVSSTFLIAPEGDKVFSAVASTSAGYVEHTDVETTNSGKSIVNVEYLMGIIEGLEARIQELENSHVYTAITEDNIDTLTGKGIIYIDNN